MKTVAAVFATVTVFSIFTTAEPPPPYVTTFEDSFAPPPPPAPISSKDALDFKPVPSGTYGAPRSNTFRGNGRHSSPKTTTKAVFVSPTPRALYSSPNSGYPAPIAIGVSPSNQYGPPSTGYGPPIAIGVSPSSQYGPPASRRTSPSAAPIAVYSGGGAGGARYSTNQYDAHSEPVNYEFMYSIMDAQSGTDFGHQESRQGDAAWGSYTVVLPDGRRQVVEYEADQHGYRPRVRYEQANTGRSGPY